MTTGPRDDGTGAAPARRAPSGSWDAAWVDALEALEMDLATAERMLALGHLAQEPPVAPWAPPTGLGPLPLDLADRARTLLDRQVEVARRLTEAADLSRRHSRAVQAMRATAPAGPVYVDTPA